MGSVIRDDVDRVMSGRWTFAGVVDLPASTIDEAALKPGALIPAAKVVARFAKDHRQAAGADVAAKTELIHIAKYAGIVASIEAAIDSAITGDNTVTIDLKKSSGGGAFASVLTAALVIDSATAVRTAVAAVLDAAKDDYAAGDVFEVVVSVTGTGTQAQGLVVTVFFEERPV